VTIPVFAVVGHPNKGKSSIVSTLARDDSVAISPMPGTTVRCRRYPMTVDGRELYVLVDTPGFQRPRKALEVLGEAETAAADRPGAVRAFLENRGDDPLFTNEVELLGPVMEGAGILYVVDGSVPFSREYEAEMEILRWTGQPRMALINPIGSADYVDEWRKALDQYFSIVRVFDALMADFSRQVELLRAFGELREEWRGPLEEAVDILRADRRRRRSASARAVAETIGEMLRYRAEERLPSGIEPADLREALEGKYREGLKKLERRCRDRVESLYDHRRIHRVEEDLEGLDTDNLFSRETWSIFGLRKNQLMGLGALGGAAAGGWVDLSLGGSSMLLGALTGAGIGAVSAALAADRLVEVKVLQIPLGRRILVAGPTRNINFPHIVFERARLHHLLVSGRSHAVREEKLSLESIRAMTPDVARDERRDLESAFRELRKGALSSAGLAAVVDRIFEKDDDGDNRKASTGQGMKFNP
jgi:GTPase Era involved in 16S rRNA processing